MLCYRFMLYVYIVDGVASICVSGGYYNTVIVVECECILLTATQHALIKWHVAFKNLNPAEF